MKLKIKGKVKENISARYLTSMEVGGKIKYLLFPVDEDDMIETLDFCKKRGFTYYILGNGTNVIFTDEGVPSVVISTRAFNKVEKDGNIFCAGSGILLPEVVANASRNGFGGMESLIGIPGTLGGGVVMNAGSYGQEIGDVFKTALILKDGRIFNVSKPEAKFWYRGSNLAERGIILMVYLRLERAEREKIKKRMIEVFKKRKETQPLGYRNAGCIFKNPPNTSAGKIIEDLGLKGKRIGDAEVSGIHANFIINRGKAKSKDIIDLIKFVKNEVYIKTDILLELEVKIVGKEKEIQI